MTIKDRVAEYTRRLGLGDLRAPSVDPEEFENVGGFQLPKNFHEVSERANQMEALAKHPGWKMVLDELEKHADLRLAAIKSAEHADAVMIKALTDRWRDAESRIRDLEKIILDAIHDRDAMLMDLSGKYGQETDDILGEAKILNQMKSHLRHEGMVAVEPEEMFEDHL